MLREVFYHPLCCCLINSSPCLISGNYNYVFGLLRARLWELRKWMSVCEAREALFPGLGLCKQHYIHFPVFGSLLLLLSLRFFVISLSWKSQSVLEILMSEVKGGRWVDFRQMSLMSRTKLIKSKVCSSSSSHQSLIFLFFLLPGSCL